MKQERQDPTPAIHPAEHISDRQLSPEIESPPTGDNPADADASDNYPDATDQADPNSAGEPADESERVAREETERLLKDRLAAEDAEREQVRLEAESATSKLAVEDDDAPDLARLSVDGKRKRGLWPVAAVIVVTLAGVFGLFVFAAGGLFRKQKVEVSATETRRSDQNRQDERRQADAATLKLIENARKQTDAQLAARESATGQVDAQAGNDQRAATTPKPSATLTEPAANQNSKSLAPYTYPATTGNAAGTVASSDADESVNSSGGAKTASEQGGQSVSPESDSPGKTQNGASSFSNKEREQIAKLPPSSKSSQEPFLYVPASSNTTRGAQVVATGAAADQQHSRSKKTRLDASVAAFDAAPAVPPFGTMLPVRTLGALYTLRSQGAVRLELTRDVEERGWHLRRGTVLIGQLQGADADRAFVRIAGYIDPRVNRLVSFGGVAKGIDGGDGLQGKRRVVGSAWTRALTRIGERAANLTQSWLAGRNGGTTVVMGANQPAIAELDGIELRERRREFVEVAAGTQGYVMVTDLPRAVEGQVPASLEAPGDDTLSETEIAHLLTVGTPDEIRASMPRMSPEMRKIAADVLKTAH